MDYISLFFQSIYSNMVKEINKCMAQQKEGNAQEGKYRDMVFYASPLLWLAGVWWEKKSQRPLVPKSFLRVDRPFHYEIPPRRAWRAFEES